MQLWLCPVIAFLLGSIPFGLLIARANGIDIRKHGSGNIGATNVFRIVGKKQGLVCLLVDALKGFLPVMLAINLVPVAGREAMLHVGFLDGLAMFPGPERATAQLVHVLTALAAVLGHNYSPWVGFKGGKGIATSAGVVIALMPAAIVILILVFLVTLVATRYVAVASMVSAVALPLLTHFGARFHKDASGMSLWEAGTWNRPLFYFTVVIGLMAVWKHRTNIRRLMDGAESRFVWGGKRKGAGDEV